MTKEKRLLDFIQSEILGIIALKQLNNETIPEISSNHIYSLSKSILYEWQDLGEPKAVLNDMITDELSGIIKWNLEQHISHS
jgi:hypothetical protein